LIDLVALALLYALLLLVAHCCSLFVMVMLMMAAMLEWCFGVSVISLAFPRRTSVVSSPARPLAHSLAHSLKRKTTLCGSPRQLRLFVAFVLSSRKPINSSSM